MKQRDALTKVFVSIVALGTALLHIATPFKLDNTALVLEASIFSCVPILVPWVATSNLTIQMQRTVESRWC
jgi:threonine/homoserine efflux transporter RhtA